MLGKHTLLSLTSSPFGMFHATALFTGEGNESQRSEELYPGTLGLGWGLGHTRFPRLVLTGKLRHDLLPQGLAVLFGGQSLRQWSRTGKGREMAKHNFLLGVCIGHVRVRA